MLALAAMIRTLSLRYVSQHWDRTALIVASIGLGVAMLVSTQLLNQCLNDAVTQSTSLGVEQADLVVTSNRRIKIDLAKKLRAVPGVQSAQPLLFDRVVLPEFQNRTVILLGVDMTSGAGLPADRNPFDARVTITNPGALLFGQGAFMGHELATALSPDGKPARLFQIRAGGSVQLVQPAGVVEVSGKAEKLGGMLLAMDVRAAARILGQEGIAERIDLYLEPGADRKQVRRAAQAAVGDQAIVQVPESVGKGSRELAGGVTLAFTLCGIGALIVGLFLVYNALAVSVAERRHDIGVLRSLGATRPQIAGLFVCEAVVLGFLGTLLGAPLGLSLARLTRFLVRQELAQLFLTPDLPIVLTTHLFLLALASGTATAVLAALVPAMQAAADEPADAVRRAPSGAARFFRVLQAAGSLLLVGGGFSVVFLRDYLPPRIGGIGGMAFLLVGVLLAIPLLVGLLARLLQPLFRRLLGIEARLAADNLLRAPGRTGVVVGALAAGVALMLQTAGLSRSNEEPVLEWLDRVVSADMIIVAGDPGSSGNVVLPLPPNIVEELRAKPGVEYVMTVRYNQPEFNNRLVFITALDAQVYHDSNRHRDRLPQLPLFAKLAEPGTCLISENFSALHKVNAGDSFSLQGPNGPVALRVLGVVPEYSWSRGTILMDRAVYAEAFSDWTIEGCHVFFRADAAPDARREVKRYCDAQALIILTPGDVNDFLVKFLRRLYTLAYMQQIAIGVVAALGVVMALLISVLQRRRELGLLRAVGASQGQVLHTVLAEATLMGIFGTLLGVLAGIPLEWYLLRVVIFEDTGFTFPVTIPWRATIILSLLAVGTATLAGIVPALHAARLRIAEAIAYE